MNKHLQYLGYVIKHKWYTFQAARALGITWLGIIHDWTKFLPSEWFPYVNFFHGPKLTQRRNETGYYDPSNHQDLDFKYAWLHHQKSNRHHWQYYLLQYDLGDDWTLQPRTEDGSLADFFHQGRATKVIHEDWSREAWLDRDMDNLGVRAAYMLNLSPVALPMPERYRREMVADWQGAGIAQGKPDTAEWYKKNRHSITLHPETREWVEKELGIAYLYPRGTICDRRESCLLESK